MSGLSATMGSLAPADGPTGDGPLTGGGPRDVPTIHHRRGGTHRWGPRSPLRRRHLALVGSALAVVLILIVFARALSEASATNERAALHRAENARLQERLAAGRREVELIKDPAFVALQARAYGLGEPGEKVFGLAPGAPPPRPITPLGQPAGATEVRPIDAWLELLFGP